MAEPRLERVTCMYTDAFDDMYPEFAPDPIVVTCNRRAVYVAAFEDAHPAPDDPPQLCLLVCVEHAATVAEDPQITGTKFWELTDEATPDEVREDYRATLAEANDRAEEQRQGNLYGRNVL